jgi:RNA polymerase-binding transcription factor DksA
VIKSSIQRVTDSARMLLLFGEQRGGIEMGNLPRGHPTDPRAASHQSRNGSTGHFDAIRNSLSERSRRLNRRAEMLEHQLDRLSDQTSELESHAEALIRGLISGAHQEIAQIESSMRRIANNEFDCCMSCGAAIPVDQLALFPYSVNCRGCSADFPLDYSEKLRVQHVHMRESLNALGDLIDNVLRKRSTGLPAGTEWAAALIILEDLGRDLPEHFALEERDGYLAAAVNAAPRFHRQATQLLAQHAEFAQRLNSLLTRARQLEDSVTSYLGWKQEFLRISADLLEHERAENDLIGQAHTEDIGSPG